MYKGLDVSNKSVLVTGGTSGIGRAIALGLAQAGAKVAERLGLPSLIVPGIYLALWAAWETYLHFVRPNLWLRADLFLKLALQLASKKHRPQTVQEHAQSVHRLTLRRCKEPLNDVRRPSPGLLFQGKLFPPGAGD